MLAVALAPEDDCITDLDARTPNNRHNAISTRICLLGKCSPSHECSVGPTDWAQLSHRFWEVLKQVRCIGMDLCHTHTTTKRNRIILNISTFDIIIIINIIIVCVCVLSCLRELFTKYVTWVCVCVCVWGVRRFDVKWRCAIVLLVRLSLYLHCNLLCFVFAIVV